MKPSRHIVRNNYSLIIHNASQNIVRMYSICLINFWVKNTKKTREFLCCAGNKNFCVFFILWSYDILIRCQGQQNVNMDIHLQMRVIFRAKNLHVLRINIIIVRSVIVQQFLTVFWLCSSVFHLIVIHSVNLPGMKCMMVVDEILCLERKMYQE